MKTILMHTCLAVGLLVGASCSADDGISNLTKRLNSEAGGLWMNGTQPAFSLSSNSSPTQVVAAAVRAWRVANGTNDAVRILEVRPVQLNVTSGSPWTAVLLECAAGRKILLYCHESKDHWFTRFFDVEDEGGAAWWWSCKREDFIVRGELTYGDQPAITCISKYQDKPLTSYYIKGKLQIRDVLYVNPNSRYPDNYAYYLRDLATEQDVLILAEREYWDHMKPDDLKVHPTERIPKEPCVMTLNVDYVYPITGLVLQAVVPGDAESRAMEIIRQRPAMRAAADPGTGGSK